jgi:hypothetical protein
MTAGRDPLNRLRDAAARRAGAGLRRTLRPRPDGLTDLASNDYLGLAGDPRLIEGACAAARAWGTGSTGSRLVTGTTGLHAELDRRLAAFTGSAAGLVFSSGFLANLGAVTALAGPGTLVVSDQVNHASIVDACRLSRSRVVIVPHRDAAAVEQALAGRDEDDALVVTDAVFSVDGDLAPLRALHAAVRAHGALLVIDEAHALGVVGDHGRGAAHAAGLAGDDPGARADLPGRCVERERDVVAIGRREIDDPALDRQRRDRDDAVAAHRAEALVVHEEDAGVRVGAFRVGQERAVHVGVAARLEHQHASQVVMLAQHLRAAFQDRGAAQGRDAGRHDAQRLTAGVRVDSGQRASAASSHAALVPAAPCRRR